MEDFDIEDVSSVIFTGAGDTSKINIPVLLISK